jgi:hypothetical protein
MKSEILHNSDIDKLKWDNFTYGSGAGHIFNLSWYLDAVFPEWQAIIISEESEWIAVLPLFPRIKYGFSISLQPMLIRYSGIIKKDVSYDKNQFHDIIKRSLKQFRICHFTSPFSFLEEKSQKQKITYKLDISAEYDQLYGGFKGSLRNKINHFNEEEFGIEEDKTADSLIHLYKHYSESGRFNVSEDYFDKLEKLFKVASVNKMARIVTARNSDFAPVASILFFYYTDTIYIFIGLTRNDYKKTAIHPYLIAQEIKKEAGKYGSLDFLGSMIPGVAKFNMSFGCQPYEYHESVLKKFPFNFLPH